MNKQAVGYVILLLLVAGCCSPDKGYKHTDLETKWSSLSIVAFDSGEVRVCSYFKGRSRVSCQSLEFDTNL